MQLVRMVLGGVLENWRQSNKKNELFAEHLGDKSYYWPTGTEPIDDRNRLFAMYHRRTDNL